MFGESIRSQINFIGDSENQKFTIGMDKTLMFILDNDRGYGQVFIDDVELSQNNGDYSWEFVEGTYPIIKLSEAYMNSLKPGKYAIKIEVEDFGVAETTFKIVKNESAENKDNNSGNITIEDSQDNKNIENTISDTDNTDNTNSNNPKTGDNILLFFGLLLISVIGIVITTKFKRK